LELDTARVSGPKTYLTVGLKAGLQAKMKLKNPLDSVAVAGVAAAGAAAPSRGP
jgi:hypothetical protein